MKASLLHATRITTVTNCIAPLVAIRTHPSLYARYTRIIGATNVRPINTFWRHLLLGLTNKWHLCKVVLNLHCIAAPYRADGNQSNATGHISYHVDAAAADMHVLQCSSAQ